MLLLWDTMGDRLSVQRIAALAGVVLLVGAGLSFVPAILAQEGGDAPTPGPDGDINCDEFDNREQIGEVFDPNNDEFGLDADDDDIACESVGDNPTPEEPDAAVTDEPTTTATAPVTETATETATAPETAPPTETATPTSAEPPANEADIDHIAVMPASSTVPVGDATELNVTFRDSSGDILNIIRNVTLTTDLGVFNETGTDIITVSTTATHGGSPAHAHITLMSDEAGIANVSARSDGISGAMTVTFVDNATEDGNEMGAPTASVVFNNQTTEGTTVVVESVTMSEGGFIAIHNTSLREGNTLGSVVGVSEPLSAGTHENVEATLFDVPGQNFAENMTLEESQTLIAMPHFDTNDNGVYDFITSNATEDGPYTANGSAVVDPVSVTVEDGEAAQADKQPAEADDKEAQAETAYYQVDFVVGEPIENFDTEGTYANDHLLRFAHGSTDDPVMRRAPGVLAYADAPELNERIESQEITIENDTATITFTIDDGESVQLSLVSYEKVGPGWSPASEDKQEFIDAETHTFESGTHTLTVDLPDDDSSDE
jgi:hypothetical protein